MRRPLIIMTLFFSLSLGTSLALARQANLCLEGIFSLETYRGELKYYKKFLKETPPDKVLNQKEYQTILSWTRERLRVWRVQYEEILDPQSQQPVEIRIIPSDASDLNRLALTLQDRHGFTLAIPLLENPLSTGVWMGVDGTKDFSWVRQYNIGLAGFFERTWDRRQIDFRHEMRHIRTRERVNKAVQDDKPLPLLTGSITTIDGPGLPEEITFEYRIPTEFGVQAVELVLKDTNYNRFVSAEEMYNHIPDLQVQIRRLIQDLARLGTVTVEWRQKFEEFLLGFEQILVIHSRFSHLSRIFGRPQTYFTSVRTKENEVLLEGDVKADADLTKMIRHTFYGDDVLMGNILSFSDNKSQLLLSLPLGHHQKNTLYGSGGQMVNRIEALSAYARKGTDTLLGPMVELRLNPMGDRLLKVTEENADHFSTEELASAKYMLESFQASLTSMRMLIRQSETR